MKIETKYEIDDKAYFMHNNEIICSSIDSISTYADRYRRNTTYHFGVFHNGCLFDVDVDESKVFKTKEELIQSL